MCLIKVQRVKYLNWVLMKLNLLIFLGLIVFYEVYLIKILMLEENLNCSG
jgi:hypothetical protein